MEPRLLRHGASYFRRWHRLMELSGGLLIKCEIARIHYGGDASVRHKIEVCEESFTQLIIIGQHH